MSATENVILGIVAGILTSALLYLLAKLFEGVVLPWYRELTYEGIDLSGNWKAEIRAEDGASKFRQDITLLQSAHALHGDALTTTTPGAALIAQNIIGHTWEGYVALTYMPKNRKITSYGVAFLKVSNHGRTLEGHLVFRHGATDQAASVPISFSCVGREG